MLSSRDRNILKYIEEFGGITIQQAALLFFPDNPYNYDYARKRLKKMNDEHLIQKYSNFITDEYIYFSGKKPTPHNIFLMNFYINLKHAGANVVQFKREVNFLGGAIRSDGFVIYEFGDKRKAAILEIDISHPTAIAKYEPLFESGELQERLGDFPLIVIMSTVDRKCDSPNFTVINMDIKCKNFVSKILTL